MKSPVLLPAALVLALSLVGTATHAAQRTQSFVASALLGVGGSPDSERGSFSHSSYQLGLAFVTDVKTQVSLRYGHLGLGNDGFDGLTDADLSYVNIAGEYRFSETYFESGLFLGLGYYQLSGRNPLGGNRNDSGVGVVLGTSAEFAITKRLSFLAELAGHGVDLAASNVFVTVHGGLAFHF